MWARLKRGGCAELRGARYMLLKPPKVGAQRLQEGGRGLEDERMGVAESIVAADVVVGRKRLKSLAVRDASKCGINKDK